MCSDNIIRDNNRSKSLLMDVELIKRVFWLGWSYGYRAEKPNDIEQDILEAVR